VATKILRELFQNKRAMRWFLMGIFSLVLPISLFLALKFHRGLLLGLMAYDISMYETIVGVSLPVGILSGILAMILSVYFTMKKTETEKPIDRTRVAQNSLIELSPPQRLWQFREDVSNYLGGRKGYHVRNPSKRAREFFERVVQIGDALNELYDGFLRLRRVQGLHYHTQSDVDEFWEALDTFTDRFTTDFKKVTDVVMGAESVPPGANARLEETEKGLISLVDLWKDVSNTESVARRISLNEAVEEIERRSGRLIKNLNI